MFTSADRIKFNTLNAWKPTVDTQLTTISKSADSAGKLAQRAGETAESAGKLASSALTQATALSKMADTVTKAAAAAATEAKAANTTAQRAGETAESAGKLATGAALDAKAIMGKMPNIAINASTAAQNAKTADANATNALNIASATATDINKLKAEIQELRPMVDAALSTANNANEGTPILREYISKLQNDINSMKLSILVQTCSEMGVQAGDQRLYKAEECDAMNGDFISSNGTCKRKEGGSFTDDCGMLYKGKVIAQPVYTSQAMRDAASLGQGAFYGVKVGYSLRNGRYEPWLAESADRIYEVIYNQIGAVSGLFMAAVMAFIIDSTSQDIRDSLDFAVKRISSADRIPDDLVEAAKAALAANSNSNTQTAKTALKKAVSKFVDNDGNIIGAVTNANIPLATGAVAKGYNYTAIVNYNKAVASENWSAVDDATRDFQTALLQAADTLGLGAVGRATGGGIGWSLPKGSYNQSVALAGDRAFQEAMMEKDDPVAAAAAARAAAAREAAAPPLKPPPRVNAPKMGKSWGAQSVSNALTTDYEAPANATGARSAANIATEQAAYAAALARSPSLFGGRKPRRISRKKRSRSNKSK